MLVRLGLLACFFCLVPLRICAQDPLIERRIDSLIRIMTLEEKLGQLNQLNGGWDEKTKRTALTEAQRAVVSKGLVGSFLNVQGADLTREFQRVAVEESRLGIPLMFGLDVIHGYRTVFPIPLAEASTWDPELVEQSARIAAIEAAAAGLHWTFAPMVDIARDPRWGRIAEGSGEDPYLGSMMAAARVRGFQGRSLTDSSTIVACAKHYAAYGGAEAGRDYSTVDISERTLREIYLPPFKAAVDAGALTLMSSFNEIAGIPATANRKLMTNILREEWGFKGFVVSDWTAVAELQRHGIAADKAGAAIKALTAGVDMEMVGGLYVEELPAVIRSGKLPVSVVNEAVRRVLRVKFMLGLFDNPYRNCNPDLEKKILLSPPHRETARKNAQEAIVLLQNENHLLPLNKNIGALAIIGPLARSRENLLGPWSGNGKAWDAAPLIDEIRVKVSPLTKVSYAAGCDSTFRQLEDVDEAVRIAKGADVVLLVLGETREMSGEAASRSELGLPGVQLELAKRIQSTGKPVVLVLMNGRPLAIPWEAANIPAIVETWFLGVEAGNAIASVLFGDASPSGKLPVTFPRSVGQIPLYYSHKNTGRPFDEKDKYTSKYLDISNTPLFPFGFGLSYTTFAYSGLEVSSSRSGGDALIELTVNIENTGKHNGTEVVQLYIRDEVASVTRPVKELKQFRRVRLGPEEKQTLQFTLTKNDLSFYDANMSWIFEPGWFTIFVGGNSEDVVEARIEIR
jgi:beta-glucosidase